MPSKLMLAMLISVTAILSLIWQQDQMTMFIGLVSLVSIILVTAGGALTAMCVETNTGDRIGAKVEAFATGSILMAMVVSGVRTSANSIPKVTGITPASTPGSMTSRRPKMTLNMTATN